VLGFPKYHHHYMHCDGKTNIDRPVENVVDIPLKDPPDSITQNRLGKLINFSKMYTGERAVLKTNIF
jgi:hypothetical protein